MTQVAYTEDMSLKRPIEKLLQCPACKGTGRTEYQGLVKIKFRHCSVCLGDKLVTRSRIIQFTELRAARKRRRDFFKKDK